MIIKHNSSAVQAHRVLKFNEWNTDKTMSRLASGERITRSGDDPSGLAVSEKMRTQVHGLRQAERNTEDGMSLIQTTEGYLQQTSDILQRIRVLAIQSSNGIYTSEDRQLIQVEVSQLVDEVDRVSSQAEFNRHALLQGDFSKTSKKGSMWFHMGPNANQRSRVFIGTMSSKALNLRGVDNKIITISNPAQANATIGTVDAALEVLMKQRADLGAYYNRLEHTAKGLMVAYENIQSSESRIRDADMAEEMVNLTTDQILTQTGVAMLAQAGVRPQGILQLLR
jgi:flagellin